MKTQITIQFTPESKTEKRMEIIANKTGKGFFTSLKRAIMVSRLERKLRKGMVHFSYRKLNGEIRQAYGTNLKELTAQHIAGKGNHKKSFDTLSYLDIEKNDWRCFHIENLVAIG